MAPLALVLRNCNSADAAENKLRIRGLACKHSLAASFPTIFVGRCKRRFIGEEGVRRYNDGLVISRNHRRASGNDQGQCKYANAFHDPDPCSFILTPKLKDTTNQKIQL